MKAVNVLRIRKHWGKACGAGRLRWNIVENVCSSSMLAHLSITWKAPVVGEA